MKKHISGILSGVLLTILALAAGNEVLRAYQGEAAIIHACINQSSGGVKVVGAGFACNSGEAPLAWNIQGPAGPAGPAGATGPEGPAGPIGPAGPAGPSTDAFTRFQLIGGGGPIPVPNTPGFTEVGSLNLPAGSYVVIASHYFTNDSITAGIPYCVLRFESPAGTPLSSNAQAADSLAPHEAVSQSLTAAATLPGPGSAKLICRNNTLTGGNLAIQTFNMNAIRVGTLTVQ